MKTSEQSAERHRLRLLALDALARREHSRYELARKLADKIAGDREAIESALDCLQEEGLLSDRRFADALIAARVRRGQGPQRIRAELRKCRVEESEVEAALAAAAVDWSALALDVLSKKFGRTAIADFRERARQLRFLQYRGFTSEHYSRLLGDS